MMRQNVEQSDFTFLSSYQPDPSFHIPGNEQSTSIDRAFGELKGIEQENNRLLLETARLKENPQLFLNPIRNQLVQKINRLMEENQSIRRIVEKARNIPGYAEMTKKKPRMSELSPWRSREDEQCDRSSMGRSSPMIHSRGQIRESSEFNFGSEKNDVSTCINYRLQNSQQSIEEHQRFSLLQNMTSQEREVREGLTNQLRLTLQKFEIFKDELRIMNSDEGDQNKENQQSQNRQTVLRGIQQQKRKLMKLLKRLRLRENELSEIVEVYQKMHAETSFKLKETVNMLQQLQSVEIQQDIDEKYAEVVELQERLSFLNQKLQEMDDQKWLNEIQKELLQALKRAGIDPSRALRSLPDSDPVQIVERVCLLLIECMEYEERDKKNKLGIVMQYQQEEKKNQQKTINALKSKEQKLAKKLLELQMKQQ